MKAMSKLILALVCAVPALTATAQTVTYDFTAAVTSSSGLLYRSITLGSTITGSYVIDLSAANPAESIDLGSLTSTGIAAAAGGTKVGTPAPTEAVFASTANAGGVRFSSGSAAQYFSESFVQTTPPAANGVETYWAVETNEYGSGVSSGSFLKLAGTQLFTSDGLLKLGGSTKQDVGGFEASGFGSTNTVTYDITSLSLAPTAAPEVPAGGATSAASLLLGSLLVLRGRRHAGATARA
jgi:hypothetical protein